MAVAQDPSFDDLIVIEDDEQALHPEQPAPAWPILVVDDDDQVHRSTVFALSGRMLFGRRFAFSHARSADEAVSMLGTGKEFAVILLDVVMETEDAGLHLVRVIREEFAMLATRIVLRTGHPGYVPELDAIQNYDINDYRTKSELTEIRLLTTIASALRSYMQLQTIESSRRGLRRIIDGSQHLFGHRKAAKLAEGMLDQVFNLLGVRADGMLLVRRRFGSAFPGGAPSTVLAAVGAFSHLAGKTVDRIHDLPLADALNRALQIQRSLFEPGLSVLHVLTPTGDDILIGFATDESLGEDGRQLLEVFSTTVAVGFDNTALIERIETLAFIDPLTRLPNRMGFQQAVEDALRDSAAGGTLAVYLVDLDEFEDVNDGLGHEAGDALLRMVARMLAERLGSDCSLSRVSSDTFAFIRRLTDEREEQAIADSLFTCFVEPLQVLDNELSVTATTGYCRAEASDSDPVRLIRKAGMALKRAKRTARGRAICFTAAMEQALSNRLSVIGRLRDALAKGQFLLHYQPQIRLAGPSAGPDLPARLEVIGVEALLRWRRSDGTLQPPDSFIPAAEDSGRIVEIGEWVLQEACETQVRWRESGLATIRMAVNLSIRQLKDPGFVDSVDRILRRCGIEPAMLDLEITETREMEEESMLRVMNGLRDLGVRLAIDDFGIGYSSLSRLRRLPVDQLKIDRSFVAGLGQRSECDVITAMIVNMGQSMGLTTIAEGVETVEQQQALIRLGCGQAQGYLYARPLPTDVMEVFLRDHAG